MLTKDNMIFWKYRKNEFTRRFYLPEMMDILFVKEEVEMCYGKNDMWNYERHLFELENGEE